MRFLHIFFLATSASPLKVHCFPRSEFINQCIEKRFGNPPSGVEYIEEVFIYNTFLPYSTHIDPDLYFSEIPLFTMSRNCHDNNIISNLNTFTNYINTKHSINNEVMLNYVLLNGGPYAYTFVKKEYQNVPFIFTTDDYFDKERIQYPRAIWHHPLIIWNTDFPFEDPPKTRVVIYASALKSLTKLHQPFVQN